MASESRYILLVWGDIEPEVFGPFQTEEEQDNKAVELKKQYGDEHGIYWLHRVGSELHAGAYQHCFFASHGCG
jgi:hypothetical protein